MRRVLAFLHWKAAWWLSCGSLRSEVSLTLREGLLAYAAKQAHVLRDMAACFAREWYPVLAAYNMEAEDWPEEVWATTKLDLLPTMSVPPLEEGDDDAFDDDMFL
jgi:hypothetical protein